MDSMLVQNLLETPTNRGAFAGSSLRFQAGSDSKLLNQIKEVDMHNKILINEPENEYINNNNHNKKVKREYSDCDYSDENGAGSKNSAAGDANATTSGNYRCSSSTPKFKAKYGEGVIRDDANKKLFSMLYYNNNSNENNNNNNNNFNHNHNNDFNNEEHNEYNTDKDDFSASYNNNHNSIYKSHGFNFANGNGNNNTFLSVKQPKDSSSRRFSLDLDVVNQSDTKKIFSETVSNLKSESESLIVNNFTTYADNGNKQQQQIKSFTPQAEYELLGEGKNPYYTTEAAADSRNVNFQNANFNLQKDISKINLLNKNNSNNGSTNNNNNNNSSNSKNKEYLATEQQDGKRVIFSTINQSPFTRPNLNNLFDAAGKFSVNLISEADLNKFRNMNEVHDVLNNNSNKNVSSTTPRNIKMEILNKYNNIIPMISPSRASLNISPKSAFVFNKKLFN